MKVSFFLNESYFIEKSLKSSLLLICFLFYCVFFSSYQLETTTITTTKAYTHIYVRTKLVTHHFVSFFFKYRFRSLFQVVSILCFIYFSCNCCVSNEFSDFHHFKKILVKNLNKQKKFNNNN